MLNKAKFLNYHNDNPVVFNMFERFTMNAIKSGRKNFGAKLVGERLRWYSQVETKNDIFKINNNYISFYARMFEEKHPEYKGFFRKRKSVADNRL